MAERECFLCNVFEYSWLRIPDKGGKGDKLRLWKQFLVYIHTFTKSCSCSSTHTVLRRVGYHVSCLSSEGTRKIWLTLSFSLISVPVDSLFAAEKEKKNHFWFLFFRYKKHIPTNRSGYAKSSTLGTKCLISL